MANALAEIKNRSAAPFAISRFVLHSLLIAGGLLIRRRSLRASAICLIRASPISLMSNALAEIKNRSAAPFAISRFALHSLLIAGGLLIRRRSLRASAICLIRASPISLMTDALAEIKNRSAAPFAISRFALHSLLIAGGLLIRRRSLRASAICLMRASPISLMTDALAELGEVFPEIFKKVLDIVALDVLEYNSSHETTQQLNLLRSKMWRGIEVVITRRS